MFNKKSKSFRNEFAFTDVGEEVNMYVWSWHSCFNRLPILADNNNDFHFYEINYSSHEAEKFEEKLISLKAEIKPTRILVGKLIRFPANVSDSAIDFAMSKMVGIRPATLHELISFTHEFLQPPKPEDPYNGPGKGCNATETLRFLPRFDITALGTKGYSGSMKKNAKTGKISFHIGYSGGYYYPAGNLFLMMYT